MIENKYKSKSMFTVVLSKEQVRLLVAAPALLDALIEMDSYYTAGREAGWLAGDERAVVCAARDAIAKARGEA